MLPLSNGPSLSHSPGTRGLRTTSGSGSKLHALQTLRAIPASAVVGAWDFSLALFHRRRNHRFRWRLWLGLRRWRIQPVFEQGRDLVLDLIELVELQIGIDDGENVAGFSMFVDE